jgi:hypothetical protein
MNKKTMNNGNNGQVQKQMMRIKRLDIYEIHLDRKIGSGYSSDVYLGIDT